MQIHRRELMLTAAAGLLMTTLPVRAHHGWSSFDQDRPLYLSGRVKTARWQNPHAEVMLEVAGNVALPADLATRNLPAQQQNVDGKALLKKASLPSNAAGVWELELAPLTRMEAWNFAVPLAGGDSIEVIGYALTGAAKQLLRVEYIFARGRVFGLRSSPA